VEAEDKEQDYLNMKRLKVFKKYQPVSHVLQRSKLYQRRLKMIRFQSQKLKQLTILDLESTIIQDE